MTLLNGILTNYPPKVFVRVKDQPRTALLPFQLDFVLEQIRRCSILLGDVVMQRFMPVPLFSFIVIIVLFLLVFTFGPLFFFTSSFSSIFNFQHSVVVELVDLAFRIKRFIDYMPVCSHCYINCGLLFLFKNTNLTLSACL